MAFVAAAAIGAGAGLGGAWLQSQAAKDAANTQAAAADRANQMQWNMYQQQRSDNEPWRLAGGRALAGMEDSDFQRDFQLGDFQKDPGYEFRMQEGQKALERSAAARGGLMSGGFGKALSRYGQDYASNEYGNAYNRFNADRDRRFNRLSAIAGTGQTANGQNGAAGQNYANQVGSNYTNLANAQGASSIAQGNAWGGALNNAGNNWMQLSMFNRAYPEKTPTTTKTG